MAVSASEGSPLSRSDDLLRRLRHDLSNHINQIIGFSELVSDELSDSDPVDEELVDSLSKVHDAAQAIQTLVRDKLTLEGLSITIGRELETQQAPKQTISNLCDESLKIIQQSKHILNRTNFASDQVKSKILIVDDEEDNRSLLASRLEREGFITRMAEDGEDALAKIAFEAFDLILLDILMPKMDGFQTLLKIKSNQKTSHIPVIMISALDDLSMVVPCIEAGAEDYLSKPFNRVLLGARISSSLEKKQRHDEEFSLYKKLQASKDSLQANLSKVRSTVHNFSGSSKDTSEVSTLLGALESVIGNLEEQSDQLKQRIQQIEIRINRKSVTSQVKSITTDPTFVSLADRAKAMRQQRRLRSASEPNSAAERDTDIFT